jgi:dual specificity tyrosine-phosphorylation-regulated kinase 2/3/4
MLPQPTPFMPIPRTIRPRPSMTSESGGEEILYPRNVHAVDVSKLPLPSEPLASHEESPLVSPSSELPPVEPELSLHTSPPSAFAPMRKAKKRSSDEFELDNAGTLVSKRPDSSGGPTDKSKDEQGSSRKHRSLGVGVPSSILSPREKGKDRRRDTIGLSGSVLKTSTVGRADKHTRQTSASSSSSSHADALVGGRRVHATDFSHLPPSPSTSSIQQFLQHTSPNITAPPLPPSSREASAHSAHVAHSLLRGTQEGWSGMGDEETAEALRKLDGLSGKGARARASVGSLSRSASLSRPGTPAKAGTGPQWEGIESSKSSRRGSTNTKENVSGRKEKDAKETPLIGLGFSDLLQEPELVGSAITSSDDQQPVSTAVITDKKKTGTPSARSSFTPKRGSASSTNYTSTPTTTSSRDSAQLSSNTSATSVSAPSGRYSSGKNRRNSAGSDISNAAYSSDATSLRDRTASLSAAGDIPEDQTVPPVPPLPKDLSSYKSPPQSSASLAFPSLGEDNNKGFSEESDLDRTVSLEVPNRRSSSSKHTSSLAQSYRQSQQYSSSSGNLLTFETAVPVARTPSKKWSFSNALNIKLSSSPSSSSLKESSGLKSSSFPLSPHSANFGQRKSISKDRVPSPSTASPKQSWSLIQADAMASAASLASLSSVGSGKAPRHPTKTPERLPSRAGTASSASNHTTSALSVPQQAPLSPTSDVRRQSQKRLTPSSIPFFRRSSSHSMHIPASTTLPVPGSPTQSSSQLRVKASSSPPKDYNYPSQSVPGSSQKKSSVLSLGIPSLLKGSSSRRSLHINKSDSKDSLNESKRAKDAEKSEREAAKETAKLQKEKQKKEDKDRSESRISVMMGRKRGKVRSMTYCGLFIPLIFVIDTVFD